MTTFGFCEFCNTQCFGNKKGTYVCVSCYKPENPTFGWMVSEYMRRGLCTFQFYRASRETKARLETFLRKALDIKRVREVKPKRGDTGDR